MGKLHLLDIHVNENDNYFKSQRGKKTFNNEHGSKSYEFFESSK